MTGTIALCLLGLALVLILGYLFLKGSRGSASHQQASPSTAEKQPKVKLFISWSGLLRRRIKGEVSDVDLAAGYFYFGRPKMEITDPAMCEPTAAKLIGENKEVYDQLLPWLLKAHQDDPMRVYWTTVGEPRSLTHLSLLLKANGHKQIDNDELKLELDGHNQQLVCCGCPPVTVNDDLVFDGNLYPVIQRLYPGLDVIF